MSGGREMRWFTRHPQYCVTVVEGADPVRALAGFGAVPKEAVDGGLREATAMVSERFGYRPVVRVVPVGGWVVAIELHSLEGVRPEVLRRLAVGGRVVAVGVGGNAMRWLGYADGDGWVDRVETASAGAPGDPGWDRLVGIAERASVSLGGWDAEDLPASSMRFVTDVCGFAIDDDIVGADGRIGVALPVLPSVAAPSARLESVLRSVPGEVLADVAVRQVRDFLLETGAGDEGLLAQDIGAGVSDESAIGMALRALMAEALLARGAAADPNGPRLLPREQAVALRRRADAAHAAHALLAGGATTALTVMLQRRQSPAGWREQMLSELGVSGENIGPSAARRARSLPVDTSRLRAPRIATRGVVRRPRTQPGPDEG